MEPTGQMIDPLEVPIPELDDAEIARIARDRYGLTGTLHHLGGERDRNVRIDTDRGRFVLKVANRAEGAAVIGLQVAALEHLAQVDPDLPVPRVVRSVDGGAVETVELDGIPHAVRVVTYLEGAPLDPPLTAELATAVGAMLARIQRDLAGFFHPEAGRSLLWDTRAAGRLVPWAREIRDPALRALATETLKRFAARVPGLARLPAQVIHGDFHAGNILVRDGAVSGIIDFGDLVHAPRVQDLGIAVAYGALGADDPLQTARRIVTAFVAQVPLDAAELDVLDGVVATRLAQSVAISAHRVTSHPENAAYVAADDAAGERAARPLVAARPREGPCRAPRRGRVCQRRRTRRRRSPRAAPASWRRRSAPRTPSRSTSCAARAPGCGTRTAPATSTRTTTCRTSGTGTRA